MDAKIKKFLEELRNDYQDQQEGLSRLICTAHDEGDDLHEAKLLFSRQVRENSMSDVLIALNKVGLITDEEDEEQATLFGMD
ncbi:hypothetical protein [Enterococcus mundtii]|uniref:hypothetical protein n=1 Tax=Enterococcus mundtii TaxID=53346 RepID=UPI001A967CD2|nr:hypothetical protein [Enterococcus mundtii]MBO1087145.1 hypothetical protein [Enterococcus mundtii]